MRLVWPRAERNDLTEAAVEQLYRYRADRRWVVVNFVSSLDGGIEVGGKSAGLGNDADHQVFMLGRTLADVILVGAGTATTEGYRGARAAELDPDARRRYDMAEVPPIAVVTSGRGLPADSPVITDTIAPTIVLTHQACPPRLRAAWADAGAHVLVTGESAVDLRRGLAMLEERGLRRVDCEGGPGLFATLVRERLIDELRLTISPVLLGGKSQRLLAEATGDPADLRLASVVAADQTLLLRYLFDRGHPGID